MELNRINTSYPGRIVAFNAEEQTATVQLAMEGYSKDQYTRNVKYTFAPLIDVPVYFPKVAGYTITMPVEEGDDCLLVFAQRGIDHWLYKSEMEAGLVADDFSPALKRMMDLSDAFCFVGFSPIPTPIQNFNTEDLEIRNADGSQKIALKKDKTIVLETTNNLNITATDINITATGTMSLKGATIHLNEG